MIFKIKNGTFSVPFDETIDQTIKIGRQDNNDIVLDDKSVSHSHAEIIIQKSSIKIHDLKSYNGVKVNGVEVDGFADLVFNDSLVIGTHEYLITDDRITDQARLISQESLPEEATSKKFRCGNPLLIFLFICLLQLLIPLQTIFRNESVIWSGTEYKFQTAPVDPHDIFRGKYVVLRFKQTSVQVKDLLQWDVEDEAYLILSIDEQGFAIISEARTSAPEDDRDYLFLKVTRRPVEIGEKKSGPLRFAFPFKRFYMEESKARPAENLVRNNRRKRNTYALVKVKNGKSSLVDVMIDDRSLKNLVEESMNKKEREPIRTR